MRSPTHLLAAFAAAAVVTTIAPGTLHAAGLDFTFAALPDTQKYLDSNYSYEPMETVDPTLPAFSVGFAAQTQWLANNVAAQKIAFVSHLGDVTEHGGGSGGDPTTKPGIISAGFFRPNGNRVEWNAANAAMNILNGAVPYSVLPGNHDYDFVNADRSLGVAAATTTAMAMPFADRSAGEYLARFGPQRFAGSTFATGTTPNAANFFLGASANGLNTAQRFRGGGRDFVHLSLEWEAPDSALAFAQSVVDANPGVPVILSTHSYIWDQPGSEGRFGAQISQAAANNVTFPYPIVRPDGSFSQTAAGNNGEDIYNEFVRVNPNVVMVLNGHWSQPAGEGAQNQNIGEWAQVSQNDAGLPVYEMLADYQDEQLGGDGWLRLVEFRLDQGADGSDVLLMRTYSPTRDMMDGTLDFDENSFKPNDSMTWQNGLGIRFGDVTDATVFPVGLTFDPRDSQFYYTLDLDQRLSGAVPEPGTMALALMGGAGTLVLACRRRRRSQQ